MQVVSELLEIEPDGDVQSTSFPLDSQIEEARKKRNCYCQLILMLDGAYSPTVFATRLMQFILEENQVRTIIYRLDRMLQVFFPDTNAEDMEYTCRQIAGTNIGGGVKAMLTQEQYWRNSPAQALQQKWRDSFSKQPTAA